MPAKCLQCPKVFRVAAACTGDKGQELFTKKNALEKKGKRNPYKLNMFMQAREEGNVPGIPIALQVFL